MRVVSTSPPDPNSKRAKLIRNSFFSISAWLVPLVPAFFVTPIVLERLGFEQYGIYALVTGLVSYFFVLNIGKAATKFVAEFRARGETSRIDQAVSATMITSFLAGVLGILPIVIFAGPIVDRLLEIDGPLQETSRITLLLGCANILVLTVTLTFNFVLQGLQLFQRAFWISNVSTLLMHGGVLLVVFLGLGVKAVFVAIVTSSVISGLVSFAVLKNAMQGLRFTINISRELWFDVWKYGGSIVLYQLFSSATFLFERAWVTRLFGPEALAFYAVPMTLAIYMQSFFGSIAIAVFPVLNEYMGQPNVLLNIYRKSIKLVLLLVGFVLATSITGGYRFLALWISDELAAVSYTLLIIHVCSFSVIAMTVTAWQVAETYRCAPVNAAANFLLMVISVVAMILLASSFGLTGIAYGRFAGTLAYLPLLIYVEKRLLEGNTLAFWTSNLLKISSVAAATGAIEYFLFLQFDNTWPTLILVTSIGLSVYGLGMYAVRVLDRDEWTLISGILKRPLTSFK